ncbi:MAG: hypothetical protein WBA63_06380 [Thermomicrobiales bacterium]
MEANHSIACRLSEPDKAQRLTRLREQLFVTATNVVETTAGIAFSFANDDDTVDRVLHFVASERLCCPFLTFHVAIPPAPASITLTMPGDDQISAFVRDTFVALIPGMLHE